MVSGGGIIDDENVGEVGLDTSEVLDEVAVDVVAVVAEEAALHDAVGVERGDEGVSVLALAGGVDGDVEPLRGGAQELVQIGALGHVEDRGGVDVEPHVGLGVALQLRVHERLVQVQHQGLA